jgi:hypothetical protein
MAAATVAVRITTSSPILDLSKQDPFTFTVSLTLNHTHPITFDKTATTFYGGKLLYEGGLQFMDTTTKQIVRRNTINICYMSSYDQDGTPTKSSKETFATLYPGKPSIIEATLKPFIPPAFFSAKDLTDEEIVTKQESQEKTWKWGNVGGFVDGSVYEVGFHEEVGLRLWLQGSVDGLLAVKELGLRPQIRREVIRFVIEENAKFEVRRPDKDGSLNWP